MTKQQHGLGRGLSALISESETAAPAAESVNKPVVGYINELPSAAHGPSGAEVLNIPVEMIEANPFQPRMSFDPAGLDELAASIKNIGLIQPITVRRISPARYQIITGERRYRASRIAGLETVPAYVRTADDTGMLELALVENIQREDLDPIEVALSYQRLIDECSLTQEQMADKVGKNRATVANSLRLLKLPAKVQHDLKTGLISTGHAKALLSLEDAEMQEHLCEKAVAGRMSVRELEALVRRTLEGSKSLPTPENRLPGQFARLSGELGRYFSRNVSVRRYDTGRGTITIHFNSDAEVAALLGALERE